MPDTTTQQTEIICPKCGNTNPPGTLMCSLCGAAFALFNNTSDIPGDGIGPLSELKGLEKRDFTAEIRSNTSKSIFLLFWLILVLLGLGFVLGEYFLRDGLIGTAIAAGIAIIGGWSAWFGGSMALMYAHGAREVDKRSEPMLFNVVDEMRIASGLPMPHVHIIETESMNAFASGRDPYHADVAITRGLMNTLNREELQAVIAHEMGHIKNFDIRYGMMVAAIVGAIILLADIFRRGWFFGGGGRSRSSSSSGGKGLNNPVFLIIGLIFIILAPIFAKMLQMAISRKREFLADSSAVEMTRNPMALATALKKIERANVVNPMIQATKAAQHLYIVNPLKAYTEKSKALFSTHPATEERIRRLRSMA